MAGILSTAYSVYVIEPEATYGVDAVNAAYVANDDVVYLAINNGGDITPIGAPFTPDRARASQDGVASSFVKSHSELNLPIPMTAGIGTANTPNYAALLKACGFIETIGASSTTYVLGTSCADSVTVYKYTRNLTDNQWRLKKATGCLLNMSLGSAPGEEPVLTMAGQGASFFDLSAPAAYFDASGEPALDGDGDSITYTGAATADDAQRLLCVGGTITYNSGVVPASTVTLDIAMSVAPIMTQQGNPIAARIIRARSGVSPANGSIGVESTDLMAAYDDIAAAVLSNEVATLSLLFKGSTKKVTATINVQFSDRLAERDNNGAVGFDAPFIAVGKFGVHPFGDNAVQLVYATI